MPISFAGIPANWRLPLFWAEVDPSKAGIWTIRQPALLVGIMTDDGDALPDVALPIGTQAQADKKFGQGSHLANMFATFFANNFAHEVWALPVAEPTGGTAASGTVTVTADCGARGWHHPPLHRWPSCAGQHRRVRHRQRHPRRDLGGDQRGLRSAGVVGGRSDRGDADVQLEGHQRQRHRHARLLLWSHRQRGASGRHHHRLFRPWHAVGWRRRSGLRHRDHQSRRARVRICRDAVHRLDVAAGVGDRVRLLRQRSLGLDAAALRPHLLGQARGLRQHDPVRRDPEFRRHLDHGRGGDEPVAGL